MEYPKIKKEKIPSHIMIRWQEIVNTLAELLDVPAALIMRADPPFIEVFKASNTENNPYVEGDREKLAGLYCEKVILSDEKLLVTNALKSEVWKDNPDVDKGMISYLGFPLKWPDKEFFGTLCVLDSKEKKFDKNSENILKGFRDLIEKQLELIYKNRKLTEKEKRLSTTLHSIGDAVITTDPEGYITRMNKRAMKLTGWRFKKAEGEKLDEVFEIINTNTGKIVKSPVKKVLQTGEIMGLANDTTLIAKDGTRRQIADSAAPIVDNEGELLGVILVFRDVTEQYEARRKIKEENEWLTALYENSTDPIVMLDKKHCVLDINEAFKNIFGYKLDEIKGENLDKVLNRGKENSTNKNLTKRLLDGKEVEKEGTRYNKNGEAIECIVKGIPVTVNNKLVGAYGIYNDITERKNKEKEIRYISYHDELTGLYNRTFLEEEIKRLDVERQLPLSMIMIDLNGLKIINDTYGHKIGDKLLKKTAKVLNNIFRDEDIIARWGGDEFVILLTQVNEEITEKLTNRIKKKKAFVNVTPDEKIPLSLAVGYAVKEEISKNTYSIFQRAEDMMYKDKLLEKKSVKGHIIETLLVTLREKSAETEEHGERMKNLALLLGKEIGLSKTELDRLSLLAALHDIGKSTIPEEILNKPDQLTDKEWNKMKKHPGIGYRICSEVEEFSHVAHDILAHHEWWNGSGYPKGLKGNDIPILARIISIIDAFDVMTHDRPYSIAISTEEALEEIDRCKEVQFDPDLADVFIEMV